MKKMLAGLIATSVVLLFLGSEAFAAGSPAAPAGDTRPGVTQYNDGIKLMKKGQYEKAAEKFEAALEKNPTWAEAHNNLAFSLRKQGAANYDLALRHYNRAIALKPDLAEAYMYRGVLHVLMGHEKEALQDHSKLTQLNRELADALQAVIASGEEPAGLYGLAKPW
jgi:tetratricopeptide (TPR) repeat protein